MYWNGEIPAEFRMDDHLKQFTDKIAGHIRREWAYRNFIRQTLDGLKPYMADAQLAVMESEFERLQKL